MLIKFVRNIFPPCLIIYKSYTNLIKIYHSRVVICRAHFFTLNNHILCLNIYNNDLKISFNFNYDDFFNFSVILQNITHL